MSKFQVGDIVYFTLYQRKNPLTVTQVLDNGWYMLQWHDSNLLEYGHGEDLTPKEIMESPLFKALDES